MPDENQTTPAKPGEQSGLAEPICSAACPNCKEHGEECACMRSKCIECGAPVGNITFTVCDKCWDKEIERRKKWQPNDQAQTRSR